MAKIKGGFLFKGFVIRCLPYSTPSEQAESCGTNKAAKNKRVKTPIGTNLINKVYYCNLIIIFKGKLDELEEDISSLYNQLKTFIDNKVYDETAYRWLETHGKLNTNESITVLVKEKNHVKENSTCYIQQDI